MMGFFASVVFIILTLFLDSLTEHLVSSFLAASTMAVIRLYLLCLSRK